MKITEIQITIPEVRRQANHDSELLASARFVLGDCFLVNEAKLIRKGTRVFVAMPSRKEMFPCPECRTKNGFDANYCNRCGLSLPDFLKDCRENIRLYYDVIHPINTHFRLIIDRELFMAYEAELAIQRSLERANSA